MRPFNAADIFENVPFPLISCLLGVVFVIRAANSKFPKHILELVLYQKCISMATNTLHQEAKDLVPRFKWVYL